MSNAALFFSGLLITVVFSVGIGLLIWGAILDGRYDRETRARLQSTERRDGSGGAGHTPRDAEWSGAA